jgi:hypothetical protein
MVAARCKVQGKFEDDQAIIETLLESPEIMKALNLPSKIEEVKLDVLKCTVLNTDFFDVLKNNRIVTENGTVRGCMDEEYDGINVQVSKQSAISK